MSSQQTVTLTNSGSSSLISVAVVASGDFTETDNCTATTIAPGGTCTISGTYAPTVAGPESGQISIMNGVDVVPLSVPLSGVGVSPSLGTLIVGVSHSGTLSTGQSGLAYSISVANMGQGAYSGNTTVTEALPSTLTLTALTGAGWTCALSPAACTRSDALTANTPYPSITATVNVSPNAPAAVSNAVWLSSVTGAGTSTYSTTDTASVAPLLQSIAFAALNNVTMGAAPFSLAATASSGLPVTYTSTTSSVCTVSGATVTVLAVGTCSITASRAGNGSFPPAASVAQSFVVTAAWQIINFPPLSDVAFGTPPFAVTATASSPLPVTLVSNTTSVCTVSGNTITIVASGGCSITATQAGNATYAAAPPVTQDFTVLFNDVSPSIYYANAVNLFAQYGITAGCGNDDFCANSLVTRAEMAIFIITGIFRSANFSYSMTPHFTDVQPGAFGFKWIQAMYELGLAAGCGSGNYCPNQSVTRDEMAVFIIVARLGAGATFTYPSTPYFTDVPTTDFAFTFVQRMKKEGITEGCTNTTFCPADAVTRGQMAVFMMVGLFNQLLPAGKPVATQISPTTLGVGTSGTFTITGVNTNFVQGTTTLSPMPGVTIGTITVNSLTSLTVQLTAAANATAQPRSIVAITGSEEAVLPNGLTVQ